MNLKPIVRGSVLGQAPLDHETIPERAFIRELSNQCVQVDPEARSKSPQNTLEDGSGINEKGGASGLQPPRWAVIGDGRDGRDDAHIAQGVLKSLTDLAAEGLPISSAGSILGAPVLASGRKSLDD